MPDVAYATQSTETGDGGGESRSPGVVVHSQTVTGSDVFAFVRRGGEVLGVSPQEALRLARCKPGTPARQFWDGHQDMVPAAFAGPLTAPPEKTALAPTGVRGQCCIG